MAHSTQDREAQVQQMQDQLQAKMQAKLRKMAELLVDSPPEELLRQTEFDLRDVALEMVAEAEQVGLDEQQKKGGTVS